MLNLTPPVINFPPPYNKVVKRPLKIQNKTEHVLSYKVKTTAPKRYCVRRNTGFILPGETKNIKVLMNLSKDPPKVTNLASYKDKFQVQTIIVDKELPTGEEEKAEFNKTLWENANRDEIRKQKLRATFRQENDPNIFDSSSASTLLESSEVYSDAAESFSTSVGPNVSDFVPVRSTSRNSSSDPSRMDASNGPTPPGTSTIQKQSPRSIVGPAATSDSTQDTFDLLRKERDKLQSERIALLTEKKGLSEVSFMYLFFAFLVGLLLGKWLFPMLTTLST